MARWSEARGASFRWQHKQRTPVAASVEELLTALARLRAEAVALADEAYVAIQNHSFAPYAAFRTKLDEHAALITVIRSRLSHAWEIPGSDTLRIATMVDDEEIAITVLTVQASLKFCFALSANTRLPLGARETFISEIDALQQIRGALERMPPEKLPPNILDDVDTALMILQEVIDKSPHLADLDSGRDGAEAATPVAA
jgi:hypothetical protein